jgi:hypothetical protein
MALYFGNKLVKFNSGNVGRVDANIPTYINKLVEKTITEFKSETIKVVGQYGLGYQGYLKKVDLGSVESIGKSAFFFCSALDTLIIRTPKVCTLPELTPPYYGYVFWNTPIEAGTGFIYVPDNLVNSYKTATNWCLYASQIKSIEKDLRE